MAGIFVLLGRCGIAYWSCLRRSDNPRGMPSIRWVSGCTGDNVDDDSFLAKGTNNFG